MRSLSEPRRSEFIGQDYPFHNTACQSLPAKGHQEHTSSCTAVFVIHHSKGEQAQRGPMDLLSKRVLDSTTGFGGGLKKQGFVLEGAPSEIGAIYDCISQ